MQKHIGLLVICEKQKVELANTNTEILRWWEALGRYGQRMAIKRFLPNHDGSALKWDQLKEIYNKTMSQCPQES